MGECKLRVSHLAVAGLMAAAAIAAAQPVAEEAQQPGHYRGENGGRRLPQLHKPLGRRGLGRRALLAGRAGRRRRARWRRRAGPWWGASGLKQGKKLFLAMILEK
jgi:hypothetical protein